MDTLLIRKARPDERDELEALQRRASIAGEDYREALLAHPEAIDLPLEQIEAGQVWLFEEGSLVRGFMVILPRPDGQAELDGLFVDPECWRKGIGRSLVKIAQACRSQAGRFVAARRCKSSSSHLL